MGSLVLLSKLVSHFNSRRCRSDMDRYDANYDDKRITPGRVGLEHTAEEEMQLVSLTIQPLLPSIQGSHGHYQLRDCFAISSVGSYGF